MSRAEQLAGYASSPQQFRNKIINGDMRIAQRGAGAFTIGTKTFCTDRFASYSLGGPTAQVFQSSSAPADFLESLRYNIQFGATVDATDQSYIRYVIEGNDIRSLNWGIPNYAKNVTLSFWVRSSTAGLYGLSLSNGADNMQYLATYEIFVIDTWEFKEITIAGPTSGSWSTDNTGGIKIVWDLGLGSTYSGTETGSWTTGSGIIGVTTAINTTSTVKLAAAAGNFYLTGVQLEEGTVATPFEHRPYGVELSLCQRYFYNFDSTDLDDLLYARSPYASGTPPNTTASVAHFHPVTMRANPTIIANVNAGTLNRKTAIQSVVVFQWASTSTNGAYAVTDYTASIEL